MNINFYLGQQYPAPPCWSLVADVYTREFNRGVLDYQVINNSVRSIAAAFRLALHKSAHGFMQVAEPQDGAVVLLGRTLALGPHHCGVYHQGSVLHALPAGNLFQDMASLRSQYELVEFWAKPA